MSSIKVTGIDELQMKLKKNVQMSDVKKVVRKNGYAEKSTEECADRYGNSSKKHRVGNEGFRKNGRSRANSGLWCVCGTGYQIYECTALFETGIQ